MQIYWVNFEVKCYFKLSLLLMTFIDNCTFLSWKFLFPSGSHQIFWKLRKFGKAQRINVPITGTTKTWEFRSMNLYKNLLKWNKSFFVMALFVLCVFVACCCQWIDSYFWRNLSFKNCCQYKFRVSFWGGTRRLTCPPPFKRKWRYVLSFKVEIATNKIKSL